MAAVGIPAVIDAPLLSQRSRDSITTTACSLDRFPRKEEAGSQPAVASGLARPNPGGDTRRCDYFLPFFAAGFAFLDGAAFFLALVDLAAAGLAVLQLPLHAGFAVFFVAISDGSFRVGVLAVSDIKPRARSRDVNRTPGRTSKPNLSQPPRFRRVGHLLGSPNFAH
jgi:hypothetical protein